MLWLFFMEGENMGFRSIHSMILSRGFIMRWRTCEDLYMCDNAPCRLWRAKEVHIIRIRLLTVRDCPCLVELKNSNRLGCLYARRMIRFSQAMLNEIVCDVRVCLLWKYVSKSHHIYEETCVGRRTIKPNPLCFKGRSLCFVRGIPNYGGNCAEKSYRLVHGSVSTYPGKIINMVFTNSIWSMHGTQKMPEHVCDETYLTWSQYMAFCSCMSSATDLSTCIFLIETTASERVGKSH